MQMALPWSSALDVSYVGPVRLQPRPDRRHQPGRHAVAAYLAQNQDPDAERRRCLERQCRRDRSDARPIRGYGQINQFWGRGWNKYHSLQTSFNRRFTDGALVRRQLDARPDEHDQRRRPAGTRDRRLSCSTARIRKKPTSILGRGQLQRHTFKGNVRVGFARTSNEVPSGAPRHVLAAVTNDWQLSGIYTGQSGDRYTLRLRLSERRRQRERHGLAQLRRTRRPHRGSGIGLLRTTSTQQFNTAAFSGPPVGQRWPRVGPELPDRAASRTSGTWPSRGTSAWAATAWSSSGSRCSTRSTRSSTRRPEHARSTSRARPTRP